MTQDSTTPLPTETGLDKTFDPAGIEAKWYAHWEQGGLFRPERKDATPFTIVNPPPNVTGSLHVGHALDNTLQDIVVRYERLRGKDALWVVGTDHAGIATQMVVERQMEAKGDKRTNYSREDFIGKVWEWKAESGGTITGQLRRLGCSMDWSREQFTMDPHFTRAVVKVFVDLYNEGLIYRDKRLVNWDPKLKTAISDLEVETREVQGGFWHFRYPLAADENGNPVTLADGRDHIVVATTRPETMLADMAVAVNAQDPRYQSVIGKFVKLPITGRLIPIVADDHADPELGSGAVKITPGHDFNDFEVGRRAGIAAADMLNMFDADANVVQVASDAPIPERFLGLHRFRRDGVDGAREAVVAEMKALGLLVLHPGKPDAEGNVPMLEAEARTIATPFGDRGGVVIEPWLTDQWYVNAAELAKAPIAAVKSGAIEIVPKSWEKTYFNWMDNIQPWCVSRQLWWGHRIPAWYGPKKGLDSRLPPGTYSVNKGGMGQDARPDLAWECFVATNEDEAKALIAKYWDLPPHFIKIHDSLTECTAAENDGSLHVFRDSDVLDTWFSSALWPFATLGWPDQTPELVARHYPNDLLISGFDILFFWCARMAMQGMHFMGDVPWKRLYLHGLVRASDGQKMSKSKGNVVDPLGLIDKYGADALRFFMAAMESQGRDVKMDEKRVEGYRNFATKLWNAARFLQSNGVTASKSAAIPQPTNDINKWIVGEVIGTVQRIDAAMAALRFDEAALSAYHFVWDRFCDDYIEDIKGSFDTETLETAGWAFDQILIMLHPFMPFITEELWHAMGKRDNELIVARWLDVGSGFTDAYFSAAAKVNWLHRLIGSVRSTRADLGVSPSAFVDLVPDSSTGEVSRALLSQYADIIERRARVRIRATIDINGARAQIVLGEETFALPLEGIIDVAAEKARLAKAMAASQKERDSLDKRLSNPSFVEKAKPEAIEKARADHAHHAAEAERLAAALARLG